MINNDYFPEAFLEMLSDAVDGPTDHITDALLSAAPVSIRLNPSKFPDINPHELFDIKEPVSWCKGGYLLNSRPIFTLDPLFHSGAYYVQEPSSMIVAQLESLLAKVSEEMGRGLFMLDLAASPGGKSTHLTSIRPVGSYLVANEVIRSRVGALADNVLKWGDHSVVVTNSDAKQISSAGPQFDFILADLPCSGEGMFRKTASKEGKFKNQIPVALAEWSPANVELCASRQRRIVADIWSSLTPGGYMAYSTCTFNRRENDENIEWICSELGATIVSPNEFSNLEDLKSSGIRISKSGGLQFFPGEVAGDGLFFALLRKDGDTPDINVVNNLKKIYALRIVNYSGFKPFSWQGDRSASKKGKGAISPLKNIVPEYGYALSLDYAGEYPSVEISRESALKFLSRGSFMPSDLNYGGENGYVRVTYMGLGLGFVKSLGNRVNNLFPIEKRIRMQF